MSFKDITPPLEAASAIRRRLFRQFHDSVIATDDDLDHLLELLYRQPEATTYAFFREGQQMNGRLLAAEALGHLQIVESQRHWYEHPNFEGDFIRIISPTFQWQTDLIASGTKLIRNELAITVQERRRREIADTATAVALASQPNPATLWDRLEHHYRRNSAAYYIVGLLLAVILTAIAL